MLQGILIVSILMLLLFAAVYYVPAIMTKNATLEVIDRFCRYNALEAKDAREQGDLGLNPPDLFQRMTNARDYKPFALKFLKDSDIVRTTDDGKLYMAEENLREDLKCNGKRSSLGR